MPIPPVVPNVIRFRITGTLSNDAAWGVRNYVSFSGGSPTVANMLTLCEAIAEGFSTEFMGTFADSVTLTAVDGVDLSATDGAGNTADVDYSGTGGGAPLPNQTAAVLKFDISRRYRGGKPKMFLPVQGGDYLADESHFTSDFCDTLGAAGNSYNSYIKASYADDITLTGLVNVSFYEGFTSVENPVTHRWRNIPAYRAEPLVDAVGGFTCDPVMGSQKRRRLA
jgi:hypothetical protein